MGTAMGMTSIIKRLSLVAVQESCDQDEKLNLMKCAGQLSRFTINDSSLYVSCVHCSNPDTYILEIEEAPEELEVAVVDSHVLHSGDILGRIKVGDTPEIVTALFLDAVMDVMTDYDRGMVYKFNDDFSGHVIHENIRKGSDVKSSYEGLRFPAGDIPVTSRQMYMKNNFRYIANVKGKESKLVSKEEQPLDLSMTSLRGVSAMHLKYVHNMGVSATMSIAIVADGKLWGLYAFHSYTAPTKPTVEQRLMLEMVASISSMRVDFLEREAANKRKLEMTGVLRKLHVMKNLKAFLTEYHKALLVHLEADTVIVYENGVEHVYGDESIVPTKDGLIDLNRRCKLNMILHLSNFSDGLNGEGAGVMFCKHSQATIALIRKSQVSDVHWGGTPDKVWDPSIPNRLTPRTSFELYIQTTTESRIWKQQDLEIGTNFFERVMIYLHDQMLDSFRLSLETRNTETSQAIESAKERYEFFAHMSHELRTPFHGIVSSLQILKSNTISGDERKDIVESALDCGNTMLQTLDDIITIAKARSCAETVRDPVLISKLVRTTKRMLGPIADNKNVAFHCDVGILKEDVVPKKCETEKEANPLDGYLWDELIVKADVTRVGQVTNNLTSNAIKFTPPGGSVTIRGFVSMFSDMTKLWQNTSCKYDNGFIPTFSEGASFDSLPHQDTPWYTFLVEDTGCGVTSEDIKKMFDAYKQVTSGKTGAYQGTGLGLHICKSHASLMNGLIGAASTRGKGTLFFFAIPVTIMPRSEAPPNFDKAKSPKRSMRSSDSRSASTSPIPERRSHSLPIEKPRLATEKIPILSPRPVSNKSAVPLSARSSFSVEGAKTRNSSTSTPRISDTSQVDCKSLTACSSKEKMISRECSEESDSPLTTDGRGMTFLIVDDSKVNLRMTKRKIQLQFEGVQVLTAEDGLEAVELYEKSLSQVNKDRHLAGIFMDYHMPKCSGLEAIIEIRKRESIMAHPDPVYIIAFTADLSDTSTRALTGAGANEVMAKPTPSGTVEATCSYLINKLRVHEARNSLSNDVST
jgi:light-regulated signal transduction histidine kinase (bacteriophytochrome)